MFEAIPVWRRPSVGIAERAPLPVAWMLAQVLNQATFRSLGSATFVTHAAGDGRFPPHRSVGSRYSLTRFRRSPPRLAIDQPLAPNDRGESAGPGEAATPHRIVPRTCGGRRREQCRSERFLQDCLIPFGPNA